MRILGTVSFSLVSLASIIMMFSSVHAATPPPLSNPDATLETHLGPEYYGSVMGKASVGSAGNASYVIPIEVPPGTRGMAPGLSLNYHSGVENGLVGLGWFLQGTTNKITRCPKNIAQDGAIHGVDFSTNDRFCLNGQKLLAVSGSYGANGTEYRTESDQFSRIKSFGSAGSGPAYFSVERKDGTTAWYGNTSNSRIEAQGKSEARLWALNKVEDQVGNYYTYTYYENSSTGTYYPTRIDYTLNDSQSLSAYAKVEFVYETRTDDKIDYQGGSLIHPHPKRISHIKTYVDNALVTDYELTYEEAGYANQSRLTQIERCDSASNCQTPITLEWLSTGTANFTSSSLTVPYDSTWPPNTTNINSYYPYPRWHDLNGDGTADYVHINPNNRSQHQIMLSSASGSQTQTWTTHITGSNTFLDWRDMNGDGLVDLVDKHSYPTGKKVSLSTGSGYTNQTWTTPAWHSTTTYYGNTYYIQGGYHKIADMDGDRLPDLLVFERFQTSGYYRYDVYVHKNTGTDFSTTGTYWATVQVPKLMDMNGDGLTDLMDGDTSVYLSQGTGFTGPVYWSGATGGVAGYSDVNGDGLIDRLSTSSDQVFYNTGTNYTAGPYNVTAPEGDYNQDRFADRTYNQFTNPHGHAYAYFFDGISAFSSITLYRWKPNQGGMFRQMTDINGDGMADYSVKEHQSYIYSNMHYETDKLWTYTNPNKPLNLLKKINHGLGAEVEFTYKPLSDSNVYTKGAGATYPVQDVQDSRYVVSKISQSDGIGGTFDTEYQYEGLKRHLQGRGDLGFTKITIKNLDQNSTTITEYAQSFPYTHQTTKVEVRRTSDNRLLSSTDNTYGTYGTVGSGPVFPYLANKIKKSYNLGDGRLLTTTTTTNNSMDAYGNITDTTVVVNDHENTKTFQTQTLSSFNNDTANWRIGQLTSRTLKNSVGGVNDPTLDRTTQYTYYSAHGLLKDTIREPGKGTGIELTTTVDYDAFGNVDTETISGPGITTRTASMSYDNRGQFVTTLFNPLNHQITRTWDKRFGKMTGETDPNNLTTTWSYTNFGQVTQETKPDGATIDTSIHEDNSGNNPHAVYYIETVASGKAAVREFYDRLGRKTRVRTQAFDGSYTQQDTEYNSKGHAYRTSDPYFVGDTVYWNTSTIDDLGRVTQFNATDNTKDSTTVYDGFEVSVTDSLSRTSSQTLNAVGKVIEVEDADGTVSQFEYDQAGNRTKVINAVGHALENEVTYTYDRLGRLLSQDDPNHGLYTYTYDALGQKLEEVSPKLAAASQSITYQYDTLGRMTSRTEPEGTTTWTYDNSASGNKGIGKLHSKSQTGYSRTYEYSSTYHGRLTGTTTTIDGTSYTTARTYDADGNVDTETYPASASNPSGFQVKNTYNALGYLERVQNISGSQIYYQMVDTDAAGRMTEEWLGDGSNLLQGYEAHSGRISSQYTANGSTDIQHFNYTYDGAGNMASRSDLVHSLSEIFTFDNMDRLTGAQVGTTPIISYDFDVIGNITEKSDVGDSFSYMSPAVHAVTQITQGGNTRNYNYDDNGNLANGTDTPTITWSSYNKPTQVTQGSISYQFSYGPDRKRYKKVHTSGSTVTTTHYVGDSFEKITDGATTEYRHMIRAAGKVIMLRKDFGNIANHLHVHRDHLGSVTALTWGSSGVIASRVSYDAWGKRRSATDWKSSWSQPTGTPYLNRGFTGHEHLDDIDIIHMNGRIYSPKLGRMLSPDPVTQAPENGQNYNRYTYAYNNPLKYTDPSGYSSCSLDEIGCTTGWYSSIHIGWFSAVQFGVRYHRTANSIIVQTIIIVYAKITDFFWLTVGIGIREDEIPITDLVNVVNLKDIVGKKSDDKPRPDTSKQILDRAIMKAIELGWWDESYDYSYVDAKGWGVYDESGKLIDYGSVNDPDYQQNKEKARTVGAVTDHKKNTVTFYEDSVKPGNVVVLLPSGEPVNVTMSADERAIFTVGHENYHQVFPNEPVLSAETNADFRGYRACRKTGGCQ